MSQIAIQRQSSPDAWIGNCSEPFRAVLNRRYGADPTIRRSGSEVGWREWLQRNLGYIAFQPFAERHVRLWEWIDSLLPEIKPPARVEIWPRGGAKSSTIELGCARLSVTLNRRFVLYVSGTQDQANLHVQAVATHLEGLGTQRALNTFGSSKGWRRNQVRTADGFNVAAYGLDVGARGIKLDQYRPDLIVLDDIDERHDTEATVAKKIATITNTILPAGSPDCAVLFVQNRVHRLSIASQLVEGTADFLHSREPTVEEPAVRGLTVQRMPCPLSQEDGGGLYKYKIMSGDPTWEGQPLSLCEQQINEWGLGAFLREAQHEVQEEEGGLWTRELLAECRTNRTPDLHRIVVAIDPNATEGGDAAGITVCGIGYVGGVEHGYLLEDASTAGGPKVWSEVAVDAYIRWEADAIVAESNNGGEMVEITIRTVDGAPPVKLVHASRGKITRAEPVQKLYADGRFHHVGTFTKLETELCTYRAGMPSPNRLDALVWNAHELLLQELAPPPVSRAGRPRPSGFGNGRRMMR